MFNFLTNKNRRWLYQPIAQQKSEDNTDYESATKPSQRQERGRRRLSARSLFLVGVLATAGFVCVFAWLEWPLKVSGTCRDPSKRKEWRTLSPSKKKAYIDAVQCLMHKESDFEPGSYRYDDFAGHHTAAGTITHYAAAFLPWHRYFIHIFEKALVEECGFEGNLPYWDWSLDSPDFAASLLWDPITGFGGNGNTESDPESSNSCCVIDGPFANTTRYWHSKENGHGFDVNPSPRCFSRAFVTGEKKEEYQDRVNATALDHVLSQPTYGEFLDQLESRAHNSIPQWIMGDFILMTAPNDPVFYLHHAQVDRLWWMWQHQGDGSNMYEYEGTGENTRVYTNITHTQSSLDDFISIGQLADDVRAKDLMSTQSDMLCYIY